MKILNSLASAFTTVVGITWLVEADATKFAVVTLLVLLGVDEGGLDVTEATEGFLELFQIPLIRNVLDINVVVHLVDISAGLLRAALDNLKGVLGAGFEGLAHIFGILEHNEAYAVILGWLGLINFNTLLVIFVDFL